jgi:cytochrome P450
MYEIRIEDEVIEVKECPAFRVEHLGDLIETVRSRSVVNPAEIFAAAHRDPENNGAINVAEFIGGSLSFTDGAVHRDRRKLLNRLVRPDSLEAIREDIIIPSAHKVLARSLASPDADGVYRLELVEFCERVFLEFAAKLIGLVGVDSEQGMTRLRQLAFPLFLGVSSLFRPDRSAVNDAALAAKERYIEEFYRPSRRACEEMLAEVEAGTRSAEDVPISLMRLIVTGADPAYLDEHQAIIETILFFVTSVGTSTQSVVSTVDYLTNWFAQHPEDYERRTDMEFLVRAIQEAIRLRAPFNTPHMTRLAVEDTEIGGQPVAKGQEIHVRLPTANRDTEVFGPDAASFNPWRPTAEGLPRYGVAFGGGPHHCFGLRVVLGNDGSGGGHVRMLQALFAAGVQRDPDHAPEVLSRDMTLDPITDFKSYVRFPVILGDWDPTKGSNEYESRKVSS